MAGAVGQEDKFKAIRIRKMLHYLVNNARNARHRPNEGSRINADSNPAWMGQLLTPLLPGPDGREERTDAVLVDQSVVVLCFHEDRVGVVRHYAPLDGNAALQKNTHILGLLNRKIKNLVLVCAVLFRHGSWSGAPMPRQRQKALFTRRTPQARSVWM